MGLPDAEFTDTVTRVGDRLYSEHRTYSEIIGPDILGYSGLARAMSMLMARASELGGDAALT